MNGFSTADSLKQFFRTNSNTRLVNYPGHDRVFPALNFTCDTSITAIKLGARVVFGNSWPQVEIWRYSTSDVVSRTDTIVISNSSVTTSPGVYEYTLPSPLPITTNDVIALYEPTESRLDVFSEMNSGMFPHSVYILGPGEGGSDEVFSDADRPLLHIDTGNRVEPL